MMSGVYTPEMYDFIICVSSTLDFTADSPLMKKPTHVVDTSQRPSPGKLCIASCALALTIGQITCFAQAGSEAGVQPAPASQSTPPEASKQLDAIQKHIEQLESELAASLAQLKAQLAAGDKDKVKATQATAPVASVAATAAATPQTTASVSAAPAAMSTAPAVPAVTTTEASAAPLGGGTNVGPYASSPSFWKRWVKGKVTVQQSPMAPVRTASLSTPPASAFDIRAKEALDSDLPFPASPQDAAAAQAPGGAPAAPATPPVDLQTPFAYGDFTWMLSNPRNHDEVLDGKYFSGEFRVDTNYMYDYNHPIDRYPR